MKLLLGSVLAAILTAAIHTPLPAAETASTSSLQQTYPEAGSAFELLAKSPLLQQALTDRSFWDKLDADPSFYAEIHKQLGLQAYRRFGPVPSVRVRILRGTPVEYPAIILEYQTKFDGLSNWGSGPFKSNSAVFVGGGRDATPSRTVYGGTEDPAARKKWMELLDQRQKLPSNKRTGFDPTINEFLRQVMPSMPLDDVKKDIDGQLAALVAAFQPYGAKKLASSHFGQEGFKITDHLYLHVRQMHIPKGEEDDNHLSDTPYFWVVVAGGPKAIPANCLPAFPGAQGFGAMTTGGRGGKNLYVTTLNATGPGSLTEALNTKGPRTIQFRVSGQIVLPEDTWIREDNLTLVGHTAPGEGIEICGRLCMAANNIILRGMRYRLRPPLSMDGMNVEGDLHNLVLDHCSFSYGSDEIIRFIGDGSTFLHASIQNCILGPGTGGLGSHPYGPEAGGIVSFHHNVLYNTFSRSPEIDCDLLDWRNNILYNVRSGHSRRLTSRLNYVHNLVLSNPSIPTTYSFRTGDNNYFEGNLLDAGKGEGPKAFVPGKSSYLTAPYVVMPVTTDPAAELESRILDAVGASKPARDATDAHWIEGLRKRTGKTVYWKDHTGRWQSYNPGSNELANYEQLNIADFPAAPAPGATPLPDSDQDGIPDAWESSHGLNPNDAADAAGDPDKDGYTNLEEYVNHTDPQEFVDYRKPENNVDSAFR